MSSIIKFKAISGAFDEGPLCYLLEIDEYKFLLDCGWNEKCSDEIIEQYKTHIKSVDAILLSYPDIQHLGALPYLMCKLNLNCQIYSTIPVYQMGQMFLYDLYLSKQQSEEFDVFNLDDIDNAFGKIEQVKYSQTINLKGKGQGLQITAWPGGHIIGGTIWKILKDGEEEIVYAVDYNHHKERHLNGCAMESVIKPTLLITDSYNFLYNQLKRRTRDEKLLDTILKTLRNDGNILICTDTGGRMLELAHFLDQLWKNENSGLFSYSIALVNNVSVSVIEFAKSQVEWMNDKIVQSFEAGRYNPFDFKYIKLCCSLSELNRINQPSKNKLVLVSLSDLECGVGKQLFIEWCENPKNAVIFTSRASPDSLAQTLIDNNAKKLLNILVKRRIELEGDELEEYYRQQNEKEKEKLDKLKKSIELESIDESSSSSSDDENAMTLDTNISHRHDLMKISDSKNRFFKHRKQYPMFPYKERQLRWDDYGEIIRIEDFVQVENLNEMKPGDQQNADVEMTDENQDQNGVNIESANENNQIPTKCVTEQVNLNVRCKIISIDYEGRSDGESIKKILLNIKPRNLIIVHGNEKSTLEMQEFCQKQQLVQDRIFMPRVGEMVNATLETQIYNVRLKDELVSSLKFQKLKDYELAWVDAIIRTKNFQTESEAFNQQNNNTGTPNMLDFGLSLHPIPKEQLTPHKTVFVNEPKLSDLKQILAQRDIQAEFHGGVLVCNGIIALKKNQSGRIVLEGVVSDDYYKVRSILYEQYAML